MEAHPYFERIWEVYPKKDNKHSASKAFMALLALENDIDLDRLIKAIKVYAATQNPNYYRDLGNWLRGDHWKDIYSMEDMDYLIKRHEKNSVEADRFIKHWNKNKFKWWLPISDHATRRNIVFEAMSDPYFFDNWEEGFRIMRIVFKMRALLTNTNQR